MASALIVLSRIDGDSWPVYLEEDPVYAEGTLVSTPGPLIASVTSWEELRGVADERGIASHELQGDDALAEMEEKLGLMPSW